jgi:hypothetical protein
MYLHFLPGYTVREGGLPPWSYGFEERVNAQQGAEREYREHEYALEPGKMHISTDTGFDPSGEKGRRFSSYSPDHAGINGEGSFEDP